MIDWEYHHNKGVRLKTSERLIEDEMTKILIELNKRVSSEHLMFLENFFLENGHCSSGQQYIDKYKLSDIEIAALGNDEQFIDTYLDEKYMELCS